MKSIINYMKKVLNSEDMAQFQKKFDEKTYILTAKHQNLKY